VNSALFQLIDLIFQFLYLILIVRVVLSWIPHDPHHPIISVVYRITDPILKANVLESPSFATRSISGPPG